jgi:coenzyme PQQ precursor peptide PqqA
MVKHLQVTTGTGNAAARRKLFQQGRVFGIAKAWYRSRPIIRQESLMKWTAPKVVEICVGMEINCYACAEL